MPNVEEIRQRAKEIAENHKIRKGAALSRNAFPRIDEDIEVLFKAYKVTNEVVKKKGYIVPAAEWLLDNFYMIEEQIKDIKHSLSQECYSELPVLEAGKYKGLPRVYALVEEMLSYTDGCLSDDDIKAFIIGYQSIAPLTSRELWVIPIMIRIALIKKIRSISVHIVESQNLKEEAEKWAERLLAAIENAEEDIQRVISEHDSQIGTMIPAYAERLLKCLREHGSEAAPIIRWIDGKLALQGTNAEEIIQQEHQQQAAYKVSIGNAITTLRFLAGIKWEELFEELSIVEQILRQDPEGVYGKMEFASRDFYRRQVEELAKEADVGEWEVAQAAVDCAREFGNNPHAEARHRHVGYYLIGKGRRQLEARLNVKKGIAKKLRQEIVDHPYGFYFGGILLLTAALFTLFYFIILNYDKTTSLWDLVASTAIAVIPIISLAIGIVHWVVTKILPPCHIPKLEFKDGIPSEYRTLVIIPALLSSEKRVKELVEQMEVFYLANHEKNLHFALVGDFKDSSNQTEPQDEKIVEAAKKAIEELNARYSHERKDIFFYFHRLRQWNPAQKSWMGWERKRGAIVELNRLLKGSEDTSYYVKVGDLSALKSVKYIITLDADTQLPRDAAKRLVGAMAHPLNRPRFNPSTPRVEEGYGLLQPRIGVAVDSASRSFFALIFSGQTGIDPYTTAISDVYQDLFGEGIFTGKGIYDLDAFYNILDQAVPENTILSHDLLEGSYLRAGLVTDIELIDGYPSHYVAYAMRLHRWVRGDWQLIPWLFSRIKDAKGNNVINPLNSLSKWKILDNMRRSLLPPAIFLALMLGMTTLSGPIWLWVALGMVTMAFPLVIDVISNFLSGSRRTGPSTKLADALFGVRSLTWQIILSFVFLAHQAYLMVDAIARTIVRVAFTHRNMLEWVTAADAERSFKGQLADFWRKMWPATAVATFFLVWVILFNPGLWVPAILLSTLWGLSPLIAYRISRPKQKRVPTLSQEQILRLRLIARKTWKFFEDFVGSEDNWLPPDNYQEDPPVGIAHRTSPTNIGLYLMSVIAARDLGYITTLETIERVERTLSTIEKMEKLEGHLYNWYNTVTLEPLRPRIISSVDSGNLVGYLITIKQGIEDLLKRPLVSKEMLEGLRDTMMLYGKKWDCLPDYPAVNADITFTGWKILLDDIKQKESGIDRYIDLYLQEIDCLAPWVTMLLSVPQELKGGQHGYFETARKFGSLIEQLDRGFSPKWLLDNYTLVLDSLSEVMQLLYEEGHADEKAQRLMDWLKDFELALAKSHAAVKDFVHRCNGLSRRIDKLILGTNFRVVYDPNLELFSVGYDVEKGKLIKSYYDLLASEARQTSFVAIAKGDVPQKHWFRLGRPLTMVGEYKVLLSWSGTMFEYMMPLLIMKNYDYTLLDEAYTAAVEAQIQYGEQRHVPWGVSESAFYAFDLHLNYQYKAFGVPKLGLKRGLINDIVIAPYATLLALPINPVAAVKNVEALIAEGADGTYGLYEAIDYTPERLPQKKRNMVVKSFMAHHQGMALLALNNFLNDNVMQERFHACPMVRATELLLQERIPEKQVILKDVSEKPLDVEAEKVKYHEIRPRRRFSEPVTDIPEVHLLSNGTYSVMITAAGNGFSQIQGIAVNRWLEDFTLEGHGMFFYIKNLNSNEFWSATYNPTKIRPDEYRVVFEPDHAVFLRKDGNIETLTEVTVSTEHNVEIRRISLTNHSQHGRVVEVTSYFEPVLSPLVDDMAHRAFNNLFVETEYVPEHNALLARRRPRKPHHKPVWLVHTFVLEGEAIGQPQYETDRARFIGRGRDLAFPQVMDPEHPLSNTAGAVVDPIMSLRQRIAIPPGKTAKISFIVGVADSREAAISLAKEYRNGNAASRAFELAWTHSQVEMRYLNITSGQVNLYLKMASHILYSTPLQRNKEELLKKNCRGQSGLWAYGISGDIPIVLVEVSKLEHMELVKQVLTAHEYWRLKGLNVDLVLLNEYGSSYEQPVQERLQDLVMISHARDLQNRPGGVYLIQGIFMPEEDKTLLKAAARLVLSGDGGSISSQLKFYEPKEALPPPLNVTALTEREEEIAYDVEEDLAFFNGLGGFTRDGREYVIKLQRDKYTPMPWSNIVSNSQFGFLVTESGGGYTWCKNSRQNKLTPWSNDPIIDPAGEVIYLRDEDTGQVWTITPSPIRERQPYTVRHGQGYTIFEHISHGLLQRQEMFVPLEQPVKVSKVVLKNHSKWTKRITLTYYVEWVLGVQRHGTSQFIVTQRDQKTGALLARNTYNEEYPGRIAFMAVNLPVSSYTCDRTEFLGRNGSAQDPAALKRIGLSGRTGAGYDPCGALQVRITLEPDQQKEILCLLGQGESLEEVHRIIGLYSDVERVDEELENVKRLWDGILGTVQVSTPEQSMDLLLNRWLVYQVLSCRMWGRTSFYQAGGAYGFRDQLQDSMALVYSLPGLTRQHIIEASAHQFVEGDVQHWWHMPFKGIRTRMSDDLLFLPFVVADYVKVTGDLSILDEEVYFLEDAPLAPGEMERYNIPRISESKATVYEHCIRAIERALKFGPHGLPLIGTGDWNDGMDNIGREGRGESVWLGWFLYTTLQRFAPICEARGDQERARSLRSIAQKILEAVERHGWDGGWYRRAYFDDGTPLGSEQNDECQIDSISQSWAVISEGANPNRVHESMRALENYLIRREEGIIRLFTPPFDKTHLEPGYIKGYIPGVRENGGQYTHAAVWVVMAFAKLGDGNKAVELFNLLNPINHARTLSEVSRYKVEPYVMAADVYSTPLYVGRGGWTWYTGSAAWMYRVGLEHILGFKLEGEYLIIDPCIPQSWSKYEITYNYRGSTYHIIVENPQGVSKGVRTVLLDGQKVPDKRIRLMDDGIRHEVRVVMGAGV
ncbi:cellobiose phosphorylase [Caldicoprobacter guelmensis]|uniref:GH36-type glycosyl hydrolase domain-containing protein n=1 Tax=Caldicoprobacter guelmensis TaxID=1170224 RepID=UPI001FAE9D87|nr:glucoamylase family protein [Caldicoprobacter guelmensis]MBM7581618.1 cellobiose phosphorylase [Caldicoprobacter guelmensis]